jgi:transposase
MTKNNGSEGTVLPTDGEIMDYANILIEMLNILDVDKVYRASIFGEAVALSMVLFAKSLHKSDAELAEYIQLFKKCFDERVAMHWKTLKEMEN